MPFQIICAKNKQFWSKIISAVCGFALVIVAMVAVFPATSDSSTTIEAQTTTITAQETQTKESN